MSPPPLAPLSITPNWSEWWLRAGSMFKAAARM
jgi:hypothetical protein